MNLRFIRSFLKELSYNTGRRNLYLNCGNSLWTCGFLSIFEFGKNFPQKDKEENFSNNMVKSSELVLFMKVIFLLSLFFIMTNTFGIHYSNTFIFKYSG